MKIAIVLNTSWNIFNFRRGLIRSLQKQNHEVIVIAPRDEYTSRLIDMGCNYLPVRMDSRGINPVKDIALFLELLWIYAKVSPDLILHYTVKPNIFGSISAGLLGIPNIANVCGLGTLFLNPGLFSKIGILLYKLAFRFPAKVLFQNGEDKNLFVHNKSNRFLFSLYEIYRICFK